MPKTLSILLVDDEDNVHQTVGGYLQKDLGHQVGHANNGREALNLIARNTYDLILIDIRMPGMDGLTLLENVRNNHIDLPAAVMTGQNDLQSTVKAMRLGATDLLTKPVCLSDMDAVLERCCKAESGAAPHRHLIGESDAIQRVRAQIDQIARVQCSTVLITGETGTGKEVVAQCVHEAVAPEGPFVAVNCPSLTDSLLEAEFFGYVRGAFTGAEIDTPGFFEQADNGVLFLDEIADLSATAQAALLRVLETRTVRPMGGGCDRDLNLCIVAATNAGLEQRILEGTFRRDLFYRLNVFPIHLSPLREHREDILPLARHFLARFAKVYDMPVGALSQSAQNLLLQHDFPGNVRELRNMIERAAMFCEDRDIKPEHLHPLMPVSSQVTPFSQVSSSSDNDCERLCILDALKKNRWNRRQAARDLEMPYSTLRYRMQKFGI